VILAKTVKGYGLGERGKAATLLTAKEAQRKGAARVRARFDIPISDEEIAESPFFRPAPDSKETQYLLDRRKRLAVFCPSESWRPSHLKFPSPSSLQNC